jgi:predicted secreted hydrolase
MAFAQEEIDGFATARQPWRFRFPADHAAHPEYRTETWRFSGSVATPEGKDFGFQLTFFRVGVVPPATPLGPSSWSARDVYWAQLSIGDAAAGRHHQSERIERAARGTSGATAQPVRVWLEEWAIEVIRADAREPEFGLRGSLEGIELELSLRASKPPVTRTPEQAQSSVATSFHAYVVSRLSATGTVRVGNRLMEVRGVAWLDRAWGQVPVPLGAVVWDRFLVHLADGRDLMGLRLRRRDGSAAPIVSGLLVERDGAARVLESGQIMVDALDRGWRLRVPNQALEVDLVPYISSSGAARASVGSGGEAHGFVELGADLEKSSGR